MTTTIEREKWERFAEMLGLRVKDPRMLREAGSAWAPTMTEINRDKGLALLGERDALHAQLATLTEELVLLRDIEPQARADCGSTLRAEFAALDAHRKARGDT